ncbi:MAG: radical SAM protein, partial [Bacteroidetes bacterium]
MPATGIDWVPRKEVLTYEEMERLLRILADLGVDKLRITGGEPLLRKGLLGFLERVRRDIPGIKTLNMTTNGVLTGRFLPRLLDLGLNTVNLSLDTLDRTRFQEITRRDELPQVLETLEDLLAAGVRTKINAVVMEGKNTQDLVPLAAYTREHPVEVRFIEEMPFNGGREEGPSLRWDHRRILAELSQHFPGIHPISAGPHDTASRYQIPGHQGSVGIIAAFSRTFCGTCNRIRITPQGTLKTCLYDGGVLNLRDRIREGVSDEALITDLRRAFGNRARNGFEAERRREHHISESMSSIGG